MPASHPAAVRFISVSRTQRSPEAASHVRYARRGVELAHASAAGRARARSARRLERPGRTVARGETAAGCYIVRPAPFPCPMDTISIRGARTHNLKNIDLDLPRDQLIVITGLSGSGKSSLAFDTIYAEGQRRYVESLSAYARQFLSVMEKPDVDHIEGLSPAISIEQKSTSHN